MTTSAKEAEESVANLTSEIEKEDGPAPSFDDLGPALHTLPSDEANGAIQNIIAYQFTIIQVSTSMYIILYV